MTINRNLSFVTVLFEGVKPFPAQGADLNVLIVLHPTHSCLEVIAYHIPHDQEARLYVPCIKGKADPTQLASSVLCRLEVSELSERGLSIRISPLQAPDNSSSTTGVVSRPAGLVPLQTCFHFRTHSPRKLIESTEIQERFFQLVLLCMRRLFQKVQDRRFREISHFQRGFSVARMHFIEAVRKVILQLSVERTKKTLANLAAAPQTQDSLKEAWLSQRFAEVFPESRRRHEDTEDSSSIGTDAPADSSPSLSLTMKHPASTLSSVSNSSLSTPTTMHSP